MKEEFETFTTLMLSFSFRVKSMLINDHVIHVNVPAIPNMSCICSVTCTIERPRQKGFLLRQSRHVGPTRSNLGLALLPGCPRPSDTTTRRCFRPLHPTSPFSAMFREDNNFYSPTSFVLNSYTPQTDRPVAALKIHLARGPMMLNLRGCR